MAYRNKTYVCFDADTDMHIYNLMKAWKENDKIAFNFHNAHDLNVLRATSTEETIKRKLRERMNNTKVLVVLVGEKTKNLYKFVRWEIEIAIKLGIPIIAVNLNKKREIDNDRCPAILRNQLVMHIGYGQKILDYALNGWTTQHYTELKNKKNGPFYYPDEIYDSL